MVGAIEKAGSLPAITAVVRGVPTAGLEPDELERFLAGDGVRKLSARDIPAAIAKGSDGATTVAASLVLSHAAGIGVFVTGGIGGVHRDAPYDESADLVELARTPMLVVCAGAKSILDLEATWERLETLGVPVIGYQTDEFPGFLCAETGIGLTDQTDEPAEIVAMYRAQRALGRPQSVLVVQALPKSDALERKVVENASARAHQELREHGVHGSAVTPYLLRALTRLTDGRSLTANLVLLERNATLAAEISRLMT